MTHLGTLGGFPGNWNFQGDAILIVGDYNKKISVGLQFIFLENAEIDVKLIWNGISEEERIDIAVRMTKCKSQMLIIKQSIVVVGYFAPPFNISNGVSNFNAIRLITYYKSSQDNEIKEASSYFVQLRAYLNDDYSRDSTWGEEFMNTAQQISKSFSKDLGLYCALNSGYEIRCGKKYITHNDHSFSHRRNIENLYKLSFLDVYKPLNTKSIYLDEKEENYSEINELKHLEKLIDDACAFLSIIRDYEIFSIYYDFSIYYQQKYVSGTVIPICNRKKISRISKYFITNGTSLFHNAASFFECCPMNNRLSRGIQHLKLTVCDATVELKLMAACSAIEYFYSYWFWDMHGLQKLIQQATQNENPLASLKNLNKLKNDQSGKTPYLSKVIRFFLDEIGVNWRNYDIDIDERNPPLFIQIRNDLLHGSFTSNDDVRLFLAEDCAQKIGTEILFKIMKLISKSNDIDSYEKLPIRTPEKEFHTISEGWAELKNIFDIVEMDG